jgi:hypothetical protein
MSATCTLVSEATRIEGGEACTIYHGDVGRDVDLRDTQPGVRQVVRPSTGDVNQLVVYSVAIISTLPRYASRERTYTVLQTYKPGEWW